mgnify:CR=1 FL=1
MLCLFLKRPNFLILDEPTNHLDIKYQLEIMDIVKGLGVTVIAAVHDLNIAAMYCDRLIAINEGKVAGIGTPGELLTAEFIKELYGVDHTVIPDRIEAGTFMIAAAMVGGDVLISNVLTEHLKPLLAKLNEAGVKVVKDIDSVRVISDGKIRSTDIKTLPYPGFPTDLQAQFMALMTIGDGLSRVTETVFENRFMHVGELQRMGASIQVEGRTASIRGVPFLRGAFVRATDLRAGAALTLAGLAAHGQTEIGELHHIDRGYDRLVEKLQGLGADIVRVTED